MKGHADGQRATRPYRQSARATAAERTRASILDATVTLVLEKATAQVSLADVAERAGVSVQTILRHFQTREGMLDAALQYGTAAIRDERRAPAGDLPSALHALFDHYERRGDAVIRLLAQESFDSRIAQVTSSGREVHRTWVRQLVDGLGLRDDDELIDQLVVATDVYTWKLLRRDRGLSRRVTEQRVGEMVRILLQHRSREEEQT
ncbi:MAG: TetR/AcrR family transcriptional regulator [Microbacterium sp.]